MRTHVVRKIPLAIALSLIAVATTSVHAQRTGAGRITYGAHAVGFRVVCDTTGRANPAREQLLMWYPARQPPSSPTMLFSEYLAPTRQHECGAAPLAASERQEVIGDLARQLASIDSFPGEPPTLGGRFFHRDSAADIARRLQLTQTRSFPGADPVRGRFPIVVFAPGGALEQSVLLESLASHGYLVVTFPHVGRGGMARQGVESGPDRDLATAREIERAIRTAMRVDGADTSRIAVIASGGFVPGVIWLQSQTDLLTAVVMKGGRMIGAIPAASAPVGTRPPASRPTDANLPRELEGVWRAAVLDWQWAGNPYTRGVLETFRRAEQIRVAERVGHPNSDGMRRLVNPADTIASTANDAFGAYVQQFLAYTLKGRGDASAFFDRTPEANGVLAGLLTVRRVRGDSLESDRRPPQ